VRSHLSPLCGDKCERTARGRGCRFWWPGAGTFRPGRPSGLIGASVNATSLVGNFRGLGDRYRAMAPPHGSDPDGRGAGQGEFEAAFERHFDGVYRFCASRTGNPAVAQEIAQKVFAEAWKQWGEISTPGRPIAPWLFTVARHMVSGQQRDRRRKENLVRTLGAVQPRYADDPCDELVRSHTARALVGSLRSLPPGQRQVVSLCLLNEWSYEAAAAALHIPVGTVRSRLSRARVNLALAVRGANGS